MKKTILNILATTGITLVVLSFIAIYYGGSLICISTVFQVLGLSIVIYLGIHIMNRFEYRYSILETGLKLIYILALVLISGRIFGWYDNVSGFTLVIMTCIIFGICVCLDMFNLLDEVRSINELIEGMGSRSGSDTEGSKNECCVQGIRKEFI